MNNNKEWNSEEKIKIVLSVLKDQKPLDEVLKNYGIGIELFNKWQNDFFNGGEKALKNRFFYLTQYFCYILHYLKRN